jgi:cytochrome c oxidase subunit 5b
MLRCAINAARPALVARSALRSSVSSPLRAFSTTLRASSSAKPPSIFGPGGKAGEVPTDFEQATGLERFEMLGEMEGIDVFDETPLDSSRVGTKKDPIMVLSYVCILLPELAQHAPSPTLPDLTRSCLTLGPSPYDWLHG